jgi:membrane protease YdiL (CAAX protease family)
LFIALACLLNLHLAPGFHNLRAIGPERLTPDAAPFTMYLNLDKPLIGLWLLFAVPWVRPVYALRQMWIGLSGALLAIAVCLPVAFFLGFVTWDPKWPAATWIWLANNLLVVATTEEAFFRGFIQGGLCRWLKDSRYGDIIALCAASVLFGLAHYSGGWRYLILAGIAGLAYGSAYRAGGLPAAVLAHFGLNATHFFLFTYPMLEAPP